jgi:hypothetical protein
MKSSFEKTDFFLLVKHIMLSAWQECAARIECALYNQEQGPPATRAPSTSPEGDPRICHQIHATRAPPATSPRVSPLGERRLVYQIFQYLERTKPTGAQCECGSHQHIITYANDKLHIFCFYHSLIKLYSNSGRSLSRRLVFNTRPIDWAMFEDKGVSISVHMFSGIHTRPSGGTDTDWVEQQVILKSHTDFYDSPVIQCRQFNFKIASGFTWWRVCCGCVFVYFDNKCSVYIIDNLIHGVVNKPHLTFDTDPIENFTAQIHGGLLYLAVNRQIITLDMRRAVVVQRSNPKIGHISGFCFRNDEMLCIAAGVVYAVLY